MTSIRDVAKLAGVSPSTVSRVMNGTARVDDEKRQKVERAISETGFKPNEVARSLYKRSSKIIGILVPNIINPFFNFQTFHIFIIALLHIFVNEYFIFASLHIIL